MARKTTLNGSAPVRPDSMLEGVSSFGHNLATLASLQARLAACDLHDSLALAAPAIAVLIVAALLVMGSVGIGLFGVALWCGSILGLSLIQALLLTSLAVLLVSGLGAFWAARRISSSFKTFRRSGEELQRNLSWIQTVLAHSGR